jgi:hypothetical protein
MKQDMNRRLDAPEQRQGPNLRPWHQVTVEVGQSEADAVAAYEAANDCSVAGDNLILRQIVEPVRWAA